MSVEVVTYITSLDESLPTGSDPIPEGDNHLRGIKTALKQSFPNINGPVTATPDALNTLGITQPSGDNSSKTATTAFVQAAISAAIFSPPSAAPDFLFFDYGVI